MKSYFEIILSCRTDSSIVYLFPGIEAYYSLLRSVLCRYDAQSEFFILIFSWIFLFPQICLLFCNANERLWRCCYEESGSDQRHYHFTKILVTPPWKASCNSKTGGESERSCRVKMVLRMPIRGWKWYMRCLETHPWKTQLISTG